MTKTLTKAEAEIVDAIYFKKDRPAPKPKNLWNPFLP